MRRRNQSCGCLVRSRNSAQGRRQRRVLRLVALQHPAGGVEVTADQTHWHVHLAAAAEDDFREILRWTAEQFSDQQARVYAGVLSAAIEELSYGPDLIGVRARGDIAKGLFTLHVARHGRKGRHFVIFRIALWMTGLSCNKSYDMSCLLKYSLNCIISLNHRNN